MRARTITLEEAQLADTLRYLLAFPNAAEAKRRAEAMLAGYPADACAEVILEERRLRAAMTGTRLPDTPP